MFKLYYFGTWDFPFKLRFLINKKKNLSKEKPKKRKIKIK